MPLAQLNLHMLLPGCRSLKEKRSLIRPLLARLHREFNVSIAETGLMDRWGEALLTCAAVSSESVQGQRTLQSVLEFTQRHFPDLEVFDHHIEWIP